MFEESWSGVDVGWRVAKKCREATVVKTAFEVWPHCVARAALAQLWKQE